MNENASEQHEGGQGDFDSEHTNQAHSIGENEQNDVTSTILAVVFMIAIVAVGLVFVRYSGSTGKDQAETTAKQQNQSHQDMVQLGKNVYKKNCQSCHGPRGKGNGPAAVYLYPRPRNFSQGIFKFTSTTVGKLPTDQDLKHTINNGLSGTGMVGFDSILSDREVEAVVEYIKTFSDRFEKQSVPEPIDVSKPVEPSSELISRGKKLFEKNACWTCHGRKGKGNGPSAKQKDRWGNPIRPRDLTQGVYKWAENPKDLYKVIMTGINGTGMGGYASTIKNRRDRWAIVRYVQSLSAKSAGPNFMKMSQVVETTFERGSIPDGPMASGWDDIESDTVETFPLWKRPVAPPSLHVSGVYNDEKIAVLLRWRDTSKNTQHLKHRSFTDAAAIQYPTKKSDMPPFFAMGKSNQLVRIWHWRAVREAGKQAGKPVDLATVYRDMYADRYPWMTDQKPGEFHDPGKGEVNIEKQKPSYQSAVDAGNPLSDPALADRSVLEYIAEGFGTLTAVPREQFSVEGDAVWKEGEWRVMFTRSRRTGAEQDRSFQSGEKIWMGFALFDGQYDERNGKKSVSQWMKVQLQSQEE